MTRRNHGTPVLSALALILLLVSMLLWRFTTPAQEPSAAVDQMKIEHEKNIRSQVQSVIDRIIPGLPPEIRLIRRRTETGKRQSLTNYLFLLKTDDDFNTITDALTAALGSILSDVSVKTSGRSCRIGYEDETWFTLETISGAASGICIIIDDCGYPTETGRKFLDLDNRLALAVLPYLPSSRSFAADAKKRGFDVMLHLPMEPTGPQNAGPDAITTALAEPEIISRIEKALTSIGPEYCSGVNNHMGSKATLDARVMRAVLKELKQRNLFFVDSVTASKSVGLSLAREIGVPTASRDVFLDNTMTEDYVRRQWNHLINLSKKNGIAVAIGHSTSPATYQVLAAEIPRLEAMNIRLLRITERLEGNSKISLPNL